MDGWEGRGREEGRVVGGFSGGGWGLVASGGGGRDAARLDCLDVGGVLFEVWGVVTGGSTGL